MFRPILAEWKALTHRNLLFFIPAFLMMFLTFSCLPLFNSLAVSIHDPWENIDDECLIGTYQATTKSILTQVDPSFYHIYEELLQYGYPSYTCYIVHSNVVDFYLPSLGSFYFDIDNQTLEDRFFYTNFDYPYETVVHHDRTFVKNKERLKIAIPYAISSLKKESLNYMVLVDDSYSYECLDQMIIVSSAVDPTVKDRLLENGFLSGETYKHQMRATQDQMGVLLSCLMIIPYLLVVLIVLLIVSIFYKKNISVAWIKYLFYQKKRKLKRDGFLDYLLMFLFPSLLGTIVSLSIIKGLGLNLYPLFYLFGFTVTVFVYFILSLIQKKKVGIRSCHL